MSVTPPTAGGPRPLIDTHCHLALLDDRGLLDAALESASAAGVAQIISVGIGLEDSERNRVIAEQVPGVFFTVGWHPHEKAPPDAAQLAALDELLAHPRAVAAGEAGLDAYWRPGYHEVPLEVQLRSFRAMIELAVSHSKPVVVHDRETHAEVLAALDAEPAARAVMHCFSGDAEFARSCVGRGHLVSFAGLVTFPRSEGIQDSARAVGSDAYVVETDSPFLAPVPFRGRPNLPGYVAATAARVAELRGVTPGTVAAETTATARRVFGLSAGVADSLAPPTGAPPGS